MPIVGVGRAPPLIHLHAEVVDKAGLGVLLVIAGESFAFIQSEGLLLRLLFLRPGDGGDELGETTTLDDALGGLAFGVQFPMFGGRRVRAAEDGAVEKRITHSTSDS